MSTLSVSSIQNASAPQANISLNADGSVTLPVYTAAAAPALFQAGTLWFDTAGPALQIRNPANTAWVAVGGGSGTVTGVTGTLPITVATGTTTPLIGINAATTALPGSVQLADGGASQAGTSATLVNTPAFSVPKDAAGMTGAAILPSGTDAQRTAIASPTVGMQRFNTDSGYEEVYTGATGGWQKLSYLPQPATLPADLNWSGAISAGAFYQANNFTVSNGTVVTPTSAVTEIVVYGNVTIGDSTTWNYAQVGNVGSWPAIQDTAGISGFDGNGGAPGIAYATPSTSLTWSSFSPGSGASGTKTTSTGAATVQKGGSAGGCLIIRCFGNIVIGNSNTFSVNGGDGLDVAGFTRSGGGGGGAAGTILIQSGGSMTVGTSTFSANGGNGGSGSNAAGQAGTSFGGGGGGGGYIIFGAATGVTDASTRTVNGGSAGADQAGATILGGGGGGNAGAGGRGGYSGGSTQNGANGQSFNLFVL